MILAIETSCDETAVAILDIAAYQGNEQKVSDLLRSDLISSQYKLHRPFGGVVPELAAREHLTNLPYLVYQACEQANIKLSDLSTVAVTQGPGLKGCLFVGICYGKALAASLEIPMLAINHIEGHIFAGELALEAGALPYPCLALVVSGGHTELIMIDGFRKYRVVARTRDDAAGEAFDKSATLIGLPYPGGPELAKLAAQGNENAFKFPHGVVSDPKSFSFSGLKTAMLRQVQKCGEAIKSNPTLVADLAASLQKTIVDVLTYKVLQAVKVYRPKSFLLTGGVAANQLLRARLTSELSKENVQVIIPPPRWCTDNAAMIAVLAFRIIQSKKDSFQGWRAKHTKPNSTLGPDTPINFGARPRWPIEELSAGADQGQV